MTRIWLDQGHGQDNTGPGVYDPGAVQAVGRLVYQESIVAFDIASVLGPMLEAMGMAVAYSRASYNSPCPLGSRARRAEAWGADALVSVHCNSFEDQRANGSEVEWKDEEDEALARCIQEEVMKTGMLADHKNDRRGKLAVLGFQGVAVLWETGFLSHQKDLQTLIDPVKRALLARAAATGIARWASMES